MTFWEGVKFWMSKEFAEAINTLIGVVILSFIFFLAWLSSKSGDSK